MSAAPSLRPTFWQRRVSAPIVRQLTQGITPHKIALTLAVGTACAFFPILGMTTILCIVVGIALKLNQPLIQLVNGLCTIPHLVVIYGLVRMGDLIFGVPPGPAHHRLRDFVYHAPHAHLNFYDMCEVIWRDHGQILHRFELTALHAIVAWVIIAPVWILTLYKFALPPLEKRVLLRVTVPGANSDPESPVPPLR